MTRQARITDRDLAAMVYTQIALPVLLTERCTAAGIKCHKEGILEPQFVPDEAITIWRDESRQTYLIEANVD